MDFLQVNVTFYDAVNMIHDVISTANPFPYAAKFIFVGVRNNNQRTDSPESRLECNGLEVFTLFLSNLLKAFKIQNNLTIRQYYMQAYF